jgi:hypothetical protein
MNEKVVKGVSLISAIVGNSGVVGKVDLVTRSRAARFKYLRHHWLKHECGYTA